MKDWSSRARLKDGVHIVVIRRASPKRVAHTHLCLHNARFSGGYRCNKLGSHAQGPHRVGELTGWARAEQAPAQSAVTTGSVDGEVGIGHKPGGYSGSAPLVEEKSSRAPRATRGTAQLERPMVGALSSCGPQWAEVPLTSVSTWSPCPTVQLWFGVV